MNTESKENELIEMGLVLPLYSVEPDITPICRDVLKRKNINSFMGYTPPQGLAPHRRTGAKWIKQYGICANEDNIIIASGAQHAINCVLSACFESSDHIAVDYLTYPGIKSAAKRCGIKLVGVKLDNEGMIPNELEAICKRYKIKGIYTSSYMQNPTNAIMSDKRKKELSRIIHENNLLLIEDDFYRFLCDDTISTLTSFVPEKSIYIAGISKAFYAGLRIGFIVSPEKYYNKICQAIVDTVWMAPAINAEIACECINSGVADEIIRLKREEICTRASILTDVLKDYDYGYVPYSMFAWLKLSAEWNSIQFEKVARENGVKVIASDKFAVSNVSLPNYVRISLSGASSTVEFKKGINVLLKILRHENDEVIGVI